MCVFCPVGVCSHAYTTRFPFKVCQKQTSRRRVRPAEVSQAKAGTEMHTRLFMCLDVNNSFVCTKQELMLLPVVVGELIAVYSHFNRFYF